MMGGGGSMMGGGGSMMGGGGSMMGWRWEYDGVEVGV